MVDKAFRTKLKLNNHQATLMAQHAGYARFVFNWGLRLWISALHRYVMITMNIQSCFPMICPDCQSTNINKNGHNRGKQNYICKDCGRQFIKNYSSSGYPELVKKHCLHLYVEGNGFRRIERLTGVCHNTVINWVKKAGEQLPEQPDYNEIPEVAQVDELQTYVGKKSGATHASAWVARERAPRQNKIWLWTAVNKGVTGILAWAIGDRSAETK